MFNLHINLSVNAVLTLAGEDLYQGPIYGLILCETSEYSPALAIAYGPWGNIWLAGQDCFRRLTRTTKWKALQVSGEKKDISQMWVESYGLGFKKAINAMMRGDEDMEGVAWVRSLTTTDN